MYEPQEFPSQIPMDSTFLSRIISGHTPNKVFV